MQQHDAIDYQSGNTPPGDPGPASRRALRWVGRHWFGLLLQSLVALGLLELLVPAVWGRAGGWLPWVAWPLVVAVFQVVLAGVGWAFERVMENNYKTLLIGRYLRTRRIAWVSLIAVTLCTALVLVVISVMGGWLRMFRMSFHGLSGDVLVHAEAMSGFPRYAEMVRRIEQLPEVGPGRAVPVVQSFGLISIRTPEGVQVTEGVQVIGFPMDTIGNVNNFPTSLYRQYLGREDEASLASDPQVPAERRAYFARRAKDPVLPPSFRLLRWTYVGLDHLPAGVNVPKVELPATKEEEDAFALRTGLDYNEKYKILISHERPKQDDFAAWRAMSSDAAYGVAVGDLVERSLREIVDYKASLPRAKVDVTRWPGLIAGTGVLGIRRDHFGEAARRHPSEYRFTVKLTTLAMLPGEQSFDVGNKAERTYWLVDDSHTKIYQYDSKTVYVPFDILQHDLAMDAQLDAEGNAAFPAHTSDIFVKVTPGPGQTLADVRKRIEAIAGDVLAEKPAVSFPSRGISVQTWEESNRVWLGAIEKEKLLVTFLFGLISIVAVFLIFCIFYMIVVEKTRDIGIIKSVGATSTGITGIFLGYGLTIGVVGSGLGLFIGYLFVHYINEIHGWLGRAVGVQIWDPEVYAFDTIPNTMNPTEVLVIVGVAIISAVLGALIPALVAGSKNPVEALRWE